MDRFDQMRSASELLAQRAMERVLDLVLQALDVNELVQRVDVDTLLRQLDVNALIEKIDVNSLLRQVDLEALVEQIDLDAVVSRVDLDAVVSRVDLDAVVSRVDLDAVVSRVDVNRLITRIDVDAIAENTDIGAVIVKSSESVASGAVDIVRGQAVALDRWIDRWVRRLLRRTGGLTAPPALARRGGDVNRPSREAEWMGALGQYAGAASRFAAYAVDVIASWGLFTLALAGVSFAIRIVTGRSVSWHLGGSIAVAVVFVAWELAYFGYCWSAGGRTPAMALLGVRVVRDDGTDADPWRGVVRALAFPLSIIPFGLGFAGILVQREHRALHDVIAGTAVVYAWDARAARLRFLARTAGSSSLRRR